MSSFINDRRREKRYDVLLKVNYKESDSNSYHEVLTKNICKTGLRFSVDRKIPKGSFMDIVVEDPNTNALISSKAKVVWIEDNITPDTEEVIYEAGVKLLKKKLY